METKDAAASSIATILKNSIFSTFGWSCTAVAKAGCELLITECSLLWPLSVRFSTCQFTVRIRNTSYYLHFITVSNHYKNFIWQYVAHVMISVNSSSLMHWEEKVTSSTIQIWEADGPPLTHSPGRPGLRTTSILEQPSSHVATRGSLSSAQ